MTPVERLVMKGWLCVAVGCAVAFLLPGFLSVLMLFVGPLVLPLRAMPTLLLYLTAALALYLSLRLLVGRAARSRSFIAAGSALIALAAGVAVPVLANRTTERRVNAIMEGDGGAPPLLEPVSSVAIVRDEIPGSSDLKCSDECQRLLFSGLTSTVLLATPQLLDHGSGEQPMMRHRIVPIDQGCDNELLSAVYANEAESDGRRPPPYLWEKLPDLAAKGLCFRSDKVPTQRADLYLISTYNRLSLPQGRRLMDFTLRPIEAFSRWAVLQRQGDRLVPLMRRTHLRFATLSVPLQISPPFEFNGYTPGHWSSRGQERGSHPEYNGMLGHWIKNDLRILGLRPSPSNTEGQAGARP